YEKRIVPGKFIGAGGLTMNSAASITGGWIKLIDLSDSNQPTNNAVIFRYVTSGSGYLRGVFSDATMLNYKNQSGTYSYFRSLRNDSPETVYFTPYDLVEVDRQPVFREWTDYFTMVSCAK